MNFSNKSVIYLLQEANNAKKNYSDQKKKERADK